MNHNTLGRFGGWALVLLAATQGLLMGLRPPPWPGGGGRHPPARDPAPAGPGPDAPPPG